MRQEQDVSDGFFDLLRARLAFERLETTRVLFSNTVQPATDLNSAFRRRRRVPAGNVDRRALLDGDGVGGEMTREYQHTSRVKVVMRQEQNVSDGFFDLLRARLVFERLETTRIRFSNVAQPLPDLNSAFRRRRRVPAGDVDRRALLDGDGVGGEMTREYQHTSSILLLVFQSHVVHIIHGVAYHVCPTPPTHDISRFEDGVFI